MPKIYPEGKVVIDRSWTNLPPNVIVRLIFEEYGLTLEEQQKQGLPFPEKKMEEYLKKVAENGGKPLP